MRVGDGSKASSVTSWKCGFTPWVTGACDNQGEVAVAAALGRSGHVSLRKCSDPGIRTRTVFLLGAAAGLAMTWIIACS